MESMWLLYWITRAITLKDIAGGAFWICIVGLLFTGFVYGLNHGSSYDPDPPLWGKRLYTFIVSFLFSSMMFFGVSYILMPTKEEAAVIVAGGAVVEAAKSETAQRIASKSVQVLEKSLDKILGNEEPGKAKKEN